VDHEDAFPGCREHLLQRLYHAARADVVTQLLSNPPGSRKSRCMSIDKRRGSRIEY
jgi:hypothetical protein